MALTMTRTRTQTALTKIATKLANVNGELTFAKAALQSDVSVATRQGLERRRAELLADRHALHATLVVYDETLDLSTVGELYDWLKPYGRGMAAMKRYKEAAALGIARQA